MLAWQVVSLSLFLFFVPMTLGIPWMYMLPKGNANRILACFPVGYFIELGLFHFMAIPFAYKRWSFTILCFIYGFGILVTCVVVLLRLRRSSLFRYHPPRLTGFEWFYLFLFIGLLLFQAYNVLSRDTTYWSYDDAMYLTWAADALRYDAIHVVNPSTGIAIEPELFRSFETAFYFPAFLSKVSGTEVTVMERTILEVWNVILAYTIFAYMASVVFKERENGFIFLILLSILHIYGFYSQYSITFRILGPNYQGKAVMAASLCPLLFTVLLQIIECKYHWRRGVLLMFFSAAATALSYFGAATIILNTVLMVILSMFLKKRKWKQLLYIPWACTVPACSVGIFLATKYLRW